MHSSTSGALDWGTSIDMMQQHQSNSVIPVLLYLCLVYRNSLISLSLCRQPWINLHAVFHTRPFRTPPHTANLTSGVGEAKLHTGARSFQLRLFSSRNPLCGCVSSNLMSGSSYISRLPSCIKKTGKKCTLI